MFNFICDVRLEEHMYLLFDVKHQNKSSYKNTSSNQDTSSLKQKLAWSYKKFCHPTEMEAKTVDMTLSQIYVPY